MSRVLKYSEKICVICGASFSPRASTAKTCSEACRKVLHRRRSAERWAALAESRREAMKACCAVCGKTFYRKRENQKCCSPACSSKKKDLDKRRKTKSLVWTTPGAPGYTPMSAAEAERLRRALGYESYGKATAAAMSQGQTLTQFLSIEAVAAGIDLEKEAIT